jgi:hypothetical protein
LDHPSLTEGWWAVERDGQVMSRWTNGDAVLPLPSRVSTNAPGWSCTPFVWDEASVQPMWQRLADREAAIDRREDH